MSAGVQGAASAGALRWGPGILNEPVWTNGAEATAPSANTKLVSVTVAALKAGYCFGVVISAGEASSFQLGTVNAAGTFTDVMDFNLAASGTIFVVVPSPLVSAVAAGVSIVVRNTNSGGSGIVYQANLLVEQQ